MSLSPASQAMDFRFKLPGVSLRSTPGFTLSPAPQAGFAFGCISWRRMPVPSQTSAKRTGKSIFNFTHINFVAKQVIHRRYLFTIAGNDQVKVTKIRVHVERETMCGHPASDVHADGRDLSARSMHAGKALESERR